MADARRKLSTDVLRRKLQKQHVVMLIVSDGGSGADRVCATLSLPRLDWQNPDKATNPFLYLSDNGSFCASRAQNFWVPLFVARTDGLPMSSFYEFLIPD